MKSSILMFAILLIAVPAIAQDKIYKNNFVSFGVGINAESIGVSVGYYNTGLGNRFGLYTNTTLDFTPPVDDIETQDYHWFPWHLPVETKYENYIFNGGLAFRAVDQLVLYAGGGFAARHGVTHYSSTASSLNYWARDDDFEYKGNFNAGIILKLSSSWGVDGGFNSASSGGYINIGFSF